MTEEYDVEDCLEVKFGDDDHWDKLAKMLGSDLGDIVVEKNDMYCFVRCHDNKNKDISTITKAREGDLIVKSRFFDSVRVIPKNSNTWRIYND